MMALEGGSPDWCSYSLCKPHHVYRHDERVDENSADRGARPEWSTLFRSRIVS
jgi:hypothetical protein